LYRFYNIKYTTTHPLSQDYERGAPQQTWSEEKTVVTMVCEYF